MKKFTLLLAVMLCSFHINAQTTLAVGDIAFMGSNVEGATNADDSFAFVLLKDIELGTEIIFTDRGWDNTSGAFTNYNGDGEFTWTAPSALAAGTIVTLDMGPLFPAAYALIGDQLFAIQGSIASPTFIAGLQYNDISTGGTDGDWDGIADTNSTSQLPTGLTTGDTAVRLITSAGLEQNNWQFSCDLAGGSPISGTAAEIRAILHNRANWNSSDDTAYNPAANAGCNITVNIPDNENPLLVSTTPADDDVDVALATNLILEFNENIQAGTGGINLVNDTNGLTTFIVTTASNVSISGPQITISLTPALNPNSAYHIEIDSDAILDESGNNYSGIADATTWNFSTITTADSENPVISSLNPPNNATAVAVDSDFIITFSENVFPVTGGFTLFNVTDGGAVVENLGINDPGVTIVNNNVTLDFTPTLDFEKQYAIISTPGIVEDADGNDFGFFGVSDWNFTTAAEAIPCEVLIDTQPLNVEICDGGNASFTVIASGTGTLSYQWYLNFQGVNTFNAIPTAQSATLNLNGLSTFANANQYRVVVTADNGTPDNLDDDCEVTSAIATLTVNELPVVSFTAPADLQIDAGVQNGLGGGTPAEGTQAGDLGVYSGAGVTDDGNGMTYSFDPAVAGVGVHTITYTYTDGNGCENSASDDIEVIGLSSITVVKMVTGPGADPDQQFEFFYNSSITGLFGTFYLSQSGIGSPEVEGGTFNIPGNNLFQLVENNLPEGYDVSNIQFSSTNGNSTVSLLDIPGNEIQFSIAEGDDVTITFVNEFTPPASEAFVTTWKTNNTGASEDNQITIPTFPGESYNYNVDWGDGMSDTGVMGDITHTYASEGTYTVTITGDFPRIFFNGSGDNEKILTIEQWGSNTWSSMESAFFVCRNLDVLATDIPDFSEVTSTEFMFMACIAMVGNASFNDWDVSNVINMRSMFDSTYSFNQPLGDWDVSKVTNMLSMFQGSIFNQDIGDWDVSKVTTMNSMFEEAPFFNQDIGSWDVSSVTDMQFMFETNTSFNQDIGTWDVSKVTDMQGMFEGTNFNQDISNWDVSSVTDMGGMFFSAMAFNQNLGDWDISQVSGMEFMFNNAGLSTENYDATLIGWNTLDAGEAQIPQNVVFDGGNSKFCLGEAARQNLIDTHGWDITDAGKECAGITNSVLNFVLVNADTNADIMPITEGASIDLSALPTANLNIKATTTDDVESVLLELSGDQSNTRNENVAPYALFGDNAGNYAPHNFVAGSYALLATPFSENNQGGDTGTPLAVNFEFTSPAGTSALIVVNSDTDVPLFDLTDGLVINKSDYPGIPFGIIFNADLNPNGVSFQMTGPVNQNKSEGSSPPYSLFGDIGVDIQGIDFPVGAYTLVANPNNGATVIVNFEIVDQDPQCASFSAVLDDAVDPSTCGGSDGSIAIMVGGGLAPIDYDWSHDNSLESPTATGLVAGDYTVTVTDVNGCTDILMITLNNPALPAVSLDPFTDVMDIDVPFALSGGSPAGGDYSGPGVSGGMFDPQLVGAGTYEITYMFTDGNGCSNSASEFITVLSTTVNVVTTFVLVDADSNTDLMTILEGAVIDLASLPTTNLNIKANVGSNVESVAFSLSGAQANTRTENVPPYALFGDNGGNYFAHTFAVGNYSLTATPYTGNNKGGTPGTPGTVNFEFVDEPPVFFTVKLYPNPAVEQIKIDVEDPKIKMRMITIHDANGRILAVEQTDSLSGGEDYTLGVRELPAGVYYMSVINDKGISYKQPFIVRK